MSDKIRFPAAAAFLVAEQLRDALLPCCLRVEVAGSLRRRKDTVGDVELLYIPKIVRRKDPTDMFGWLDVDLATEALGFAVAAAVLDYRPNVNGNFTWGIQNKLSVHVATRIPVDFFATTEANWWTSLVIRTGGKDTNLLLTTGAQRLGRKLHAYGSGVTMEDGREVRAESERHVFELCGVPYAEPEGRV